MTLEPLIDSIVVEAMESRGGFPAVEIQARIILGKMGHQIEAINHDKIKAALTSALGCAVTFKPASRPCARATQEAQEPQGEE